MTPEEMAWLVYQNQNATRNDPLDPALIKALGFIPDMGLQMHVISGGQEAAGQGGTRTGSTRHDHGMAADVDFYRGGRKLDWNNPADLPTLVEIVQKAKANGAAGIGAGDDYMGAGRFHIGFGSPGVWGAGGKGANAPQWLRDAYNGVPLGQIPAGLGHHAGDGHAHGAAPATPLGAGGGGADSGQAAQSPLAQPEMTFADKIKGMFDGTYKPDTSALSQNIASAFAPPQPQMMPAQFQPSQGYQAPDRISKLYAMLQGVRGVQ